MKNVKFHVRVRAMVRVLVSVRVRVRVVVYGFYLYTRYPIVARALGLAAAYVLNIIL